MVFSLHYHAVSCATSIGWHYIFIRLMTAFIRLAVKPMQRRARRLVTLHEGVIFKIFTVPSRDTEGISKSICTNPQTGIARNQHRYSSTGMGRSIMLNCSAASKTYDLLLTALDLSYLLSAKIVNFVLLSPLAPSV